MTDIPIWQIPDPNLCWIISCID